MFVSAPAYLTPARLFLCSVFLCGFAFAQQSTPVAPSGAAQTPEPNRAREISSLLDLDVYVQAPDSGSAEVQAAVMLFTAAGYTRQGITKKGHWLVSEIAPAKYEVQVIAPGFERVVQEIDASGDGKIEVNVIPLSLRIRK
jgi:hypothetical protein